MLEIQKLLLKDSVEALRHIKDDLHIDVKEKDNRILFKYDQIDSPMGNSIVQECRGLILDRRDWSVLSWPFKKFMNYGEGHAAPVDISNAEVLEKIDGTCMTMYYYNNAWRVQTLGMIDAEGGVGFGDGQTFANLFWKLVDSDWCHKLSEDYCYTFEVATKANRVVTRYPQDKVTLISARNRVSLAELPIEDKATGIDLHMLVKDWNKDIISLPKRYKMSSLDEVVKLAAALPQMEEGYVVVDKDFNRVKIKNPTYVAIAHLKESGASLKGLVAIALTNEGSEFLAYFPEFEVSYINVRDQIQFAIDKTSAVYDSIKDIVVQKDFALAVQANNVAFPGILYALRAGKIRSVQEGFSTLDPKRVIEVLKLREEEASSIKDDHTRKVTREINS